MKKFAGFLVFFLCALSAAAFADPAVLGAPKPWQLGFQPPATPVKESVEHLHDILLVVITCIASFVLIVLAYICLRYRRSANPNPSKTCHNTLIEIIWTAIPILIIAAIAVPSARLLYFMDRTEKADMTLKVVGHQWYWSYEYPDHGNIAFDSNIVDDKDLKPGQIRLLETDNRVVLPAGKTIRVLVTAADVIHSWAVPAFGVKTDAVPGRVNETWIKINQPGLYYGQCSELCGIRHGFMPIAIEAVSEEDFSKWVESKKSPASGEGEKKENKG